MRNDERESLRRDLDERLLPFRLVRKEKAKQKRGWVRGIREATGLPVEELARRLGVCRFELLRLEKSEEGQRIQLSTLRRAAEGLGCELVYALVPKVGTLETLAAEQTRLREEALAKKRSELQAGKDVFLNYIGWPEVALRGMRAALRSQGCRVRPTLTGRGIAKDIDNFLQNIRVLKVAGMLGPIMKEVLEGLEKLKREREAAIEADGGE